MLVETSKRNFQIVSATDFGQLVSGLVGMQAKLFPPAFTPKQTTDYYSPKMFK